VGQVRQLEQELVQLGLGGRQVGREAFDLLLDRRARRLGLLAGRSGGGAADLLREAVLLGLERLRLVLEVAQPSTGAPRRS
jgi:hypothetical protein